MKKLVIISFLMFFLNSCRVNEIASTANVSNLVPIPSPRVTSSLVVGTITPKVNGAVPTINSITGFPSNIPPTLMTALYITPTKTVAIPSVDSGIPSITKIYAWMPQSPISSKYGYFDLGRVIADRWNDLDSSDNNINGANRSVSLNFSPYTDNIAYLIGNKQVELWVSDVDLKYPERVWIDEDGWLGNANDWFLPQIIWGSYDRYLILTPWTVNSHIAIYDLFAKTAEQWLGACDVLARSPVSDDLVIWCEPSEEDPDKGYLVLGKEGIIRTQEKPEVISRVIDWAYSPDGERVLFATEDLNIFTTLPDASLLQLPVNYESSELFDISIRQNLQWSQDGHSVLVYAYGNPKNLCPQWMREKLEDRPCWLVLDANTGNLIWKPGGEISGLGTPWEYLSMVHGATLSKDGKWLATISFDHSKPERTIYLLVASLNESKIITFEGEETTRLHWVDKK
jgi:hypothetical protein